MSSILDALQRAEAERQGRAATPDSVLREGDREAMSQALTTATAPEIWSDLRARATPGAREGLGRLMTGLAILGVLAAAAWSWKSFAPASTVPAAPSGAPASAAVTASTAEGPAPIAPPLAVTPQAAPPDAPTVSNAPVVPAMPAKTPSVAQRPSSPPQTSSTPSDPPSQTQPARPATAVSPPKVATKPPESVTVASDKASAEPATELRRVDALSADERQALGPLTVQGAVQSAQAASRLLMINGLVLREGEALSPSLRLERITPEGVELRWVPSLGPGPQRLWLSLPSSAP